MLQHLSGHFKSIKFRRHESESLLFYVHYRITFMILMASCIAVTSNLFAGEPIVCTKTLEVEPEVIASYCWSHSTYSVASAYKKKIAEEVPYPGIDASEDKSDYIYRDYYQWIYLVLFIQGVFFYIPHAVWKGVGNGKVEETCENILNTDNVSLASKDGKDGHDNNLTADDHLYASSEFLHERLGLYNKYALIYWFCEIMAWLNILLQIYFLDYFFQGEFMLLGQAAGEYFRARKVNDNPLLWVFPRAAKCDFHRFGPMGNVETVDVVCILPVNALTEKIYLFIWFWFAALFVLSTLGIFLTGLTVAFPKIRGLRLSHQISSVRLPAPYENEDLAFQVGELTGYGDWFVLSVLSQRMDAKYFMTFLRHLHGRLVTSAGNYTSPNKILAGATPV